MAGLTHGFCIECTAETMLVDGKCIPCHRLAAEEEARQVAKDMAFLRKLRLSLEAMSGDTLRHEVLAALVDAAKA